MLVSQATIEGARSSRETTHCGPYDVTLIW
jgi:hypothetical protein